ncbi:matrixin family metalloprotease [Bradyrhizobium sp. USDA 4502]
MERNMSRCVKHVMMISIVAVVSTTATCPSDAFELTGSSWAHLTKPREVKFFICSKGIDAEARKRIREAADVWSNGDKIKFSIDETKECEMNENFNKCQKINVIDRGPIATTDPFYRAAAATSPCPVSEDKKKLRNCDIRLSDKVKFSTTLVGPIAGDTYDLLSAMIHEFGHCVGLKDLSTSDSVMNGVEEGQRKRTLAKDDKDGRDSLYK